MLEQKESSYGTGREGAYLKTKDLQNSFLPDSHDNNSTQNSTTVNASYPQKSTLDKKLSLKNNEAFSKESSFKQVLQIKVEPFR